MASIDTIKATIRQLLNLANNEAAAKGEIDNAMRFASRLMEQHQLSDDDLSEVDDVLLSLERAEMGREVAHFGGSRLSLWEHSAASFACELIGGVRWYIERSLDRDEHGILKLNRNGSLTLIARPTAVFYGIAEDVEIARQVFAELTVTIASMARLKWGSVYRGAGRNYCEGFMDALWSKYQQDQDSQKKLARQGAADGAKSTALVAVESRNAIVERKKELADNWLKNDLGINLGRGPRLGGGDFNSKALADGQRDGQRHNAAAHRRPKLTVS